MELEYRIDNIKFQKEGYGEGFFDGQMRERIEWQDKIKVKIEELREEIKNCYIYECNKGCLDKCKDDCEYYMFIEILQSLLEKE